MTRPVHIVVYLLMFVFFGLVALGVTGSSVGIGLGDNSELIIANQKKLIGKNRPIRSDEWLVFTPMAIAQVNHEPRFPIVNKNLGPDGQNMLVVGMTGVPVDHVSAFAKPATWGFFVFDLRRALAWHWWFPVFGALFAVWGVMGVLVPRRWGLGLATAAIFMTSGYVVAWSNWPAYAVLFPATAFCIFFRIFRTVSRLYLMALGVLLGLSIAGFVFVLYPPWQVSVGYLFLLLTAALALRDRLWSQFNIERCVALVLSVVIASYMCWAWWSDARDAISAMQATVYPGQRISVSGGGAMFWQTFKGFVNHFTINYEGASLSNQSESASFFYLFPVVLGAAIISGFRKKYISLLEIALISFCVFVLWFQFAGIGHHLAEWTLWGRVPPKRADLSLGLASILLCSLTFTSRQALVGVKRIEVVAICIIWSAAAVYVFISTPEGVIGKPSMWKGGVLAVSVFIFSYLLLLKQVKAYFLGGLFLTCSLSFAFNPLVRAPSRVLPANGILKEARKQNYRVLTIGQQIDAMSLLAAGVPVANAVFYYPQKSIWQLLDPMDRSVAITNRYQHLSYRPSALSDASDYTIESPRPDVVIVNFNTHKFDFRLSGAEIVIAPNAIELSFNRHLELLQKNSTKSLYRVRQNN